MTSGDVTTYYYHGGKLVAMCKGTALEYVHQEHVGGTAMTTDGITGVKKGEMKYLPFGGTRSGVLLSTDVKFTGQPLDGGTGLYFYGARYYDAQTGRFISPDTAVHSSNDPQALNIYSYALNNPLKYTDPSGHAAECADCPPEVPPVPPGYNPGTWRFIWTNPNLQSLRQILIQLGYGSGGSSSSSSPSGQMPVGQNSDGGPVGSGETPERKGDTGKGNPSDRICPSSDGCFGPRPGSASSIWFNGKVVIQPHAMRQRVGQSLLPPKDTLRAAIKTELKSGTVRVFDDKGVKAFSGSITVDNKIYSFRGSFDSDGTARIGTIFPGIDKRFGGGQ